jgi:hypothetical protein
MPAAPSGGGFVPDSLLQLAATTAKAQAPMIWRNMFQVSSVESRILPRYAGRMQRREKYHEHFARERSRDP